MTWTETRAAVRARDRDAEPDILAPPDAFPKATGTATLRERFLPGHDAKAVREQSSTVVRRLASSCAGWVRKPTAPEFYRAIRAQKPTARQKALVRLWISEATNEEITLAWLENAYSYQELAAAIHRNGVNYPDRNRELNRLVPG